MGQHFLNDVKQVVIEWSQRASTRWKGIMLVMDQQKHNCLASREYFKIQKILRHNILTSAKQELACLQVISGLQRQQVLVSESLGTQCFTWLHTFFFVSQPL